MNTINVCLGHVGFPEPYLRHVDVMLTPRLVTGPLRVAVLPDAAHGPNGSSLSEYAQLLWLADNVDAIAAGFEYVRIFHYRRFASRSAVAGERATNQPWSTTIRAEQLPGYEEAFARHSDKELVNQPIKLDEGILMQYATAHVLEDMLNFAKYVMEIGLMTDKDVVAFLTGKTLIPACNIGVFSVRTLKIMLALLKRAAGFLNSPYFIAREGYQRRSMGFLLERFHSFLILLHMHANMNPDSTLNGIDIGYNVTISETAHVTLTQ